MAGLFDTLQLGSRSMQAQRHGLDVAGHNLGNVNTPGYTRQRAALQSVATVSSSTGFLGAGADAARIEAIRDSVLESQLLREKSVTGSIEATHRALDQALGALNENIRTAGESGSSITSGLSKKLGDLFSSFQTLSTSPLSTADRQAALISAEALAAEFRQTDARLGAVLGAVDSEFAATVQNTNKLLSEVAGLNEKIVQAELHSGSPAHDLRDALGQKLQALSKHLSFAVTPASNGGINLVAAGQPLLAPNSPPAQLEAFASPSGGPLLRIAGQPEALSLTSGSLHGLTEAHAAVASARAEINILAASLISAVNEAHTGGFALDGSTGRKFFLGSGSADMRVNPELSANPMLLQASARADAAGNNEAALALAQLASSGRPELGGRGFTAFYSGLVSGLGSSVSSARAQLDAQKALESMLLAQRESVSGVSIDEELTDMMKFQKAFQASARFVSVADELLDTIINLT